MRHTPAAGLIAVCLAALGASGPPAAAQPASQSAAAARLGRQVGALRADWPVIPDVVIVPDARSYVAAIAGWTRRAMYPVLIDDGSPAARENIGRFVRAFAPRRVVRFTAPADMPWSDAPAARQTAVEAALAGVWGAPRFGELAGALRAGRGCAGAVIASATDPAWTGALALAAGHGQPLVWVTAPAADPGANLPMDQAVALSGQITALLTSLGWKFEALGDEIDALTLALNLPVRVEYAPPPQPLAPSRLGPFVPKPGEALALADVIGRETGRARTARWAWCAHAPGNEAEAAYRAMSALFLRPRAALLFDGYESSEPWVRYDMTAAAKPLTGAGIAVDLWDTPRQGLGDWQKMASRPVNAGLFMLNSHGQHWNFNLTPGQGRVGDVPVFGTPAAVSVVHSWSAWSPYNAATVAGRFLLHGAFAYVGSVHEPFLQAFVPTPQLTARLAAGLPLAAAARVEDGPPWRITVIGDALFNLGPDAPRAEAPLPLAGAADLRAEVPEKGVTPEIIWSLVMLGDDRAALLRFSAGPDNAGESGAAGAAMAAFRLGDADAQWQATRQARALADALPSMRDALWLALRPQFRSMPRQRIALLAAMIRPEQPGRDAGEVFDMIARTDGKPAALAVLKKLREQAAGDTARKELDELIQANTPRP